MKPIAKAVAYTVEAHAAALANREFGASFDFEVLGVMLDADSNVHARIEARAQVEADRLRRILSDGVVTRDEVKELHRVRKGVRAISELAEAK